jgi:hypothetical protein
MKRQHDQPGMELGLVLRGIMLVLIAAWLSGCSGSDREPAVVLPFPPGDTGVPPGDDGSTGEDELIVGTGFECPAEDGSAVDALAACGGPDVICVGYFDGTSVGNLVPLTTGIRPAWSPDGLRIAFHRMTGVDWHFADIYLINADGSGERRLTEGLEPSWSPDGKRIVFRDAPGIMVINADGTGKTTLLAHNALGDLSSWEDALLYPDWSPDGQHIALVHHSTLWWAYHLVVINADGSDPRVAHVAGDGIFDPVWSPTGGEIAWHTPSGSALFHSDRGGSIWTDGDQTRPLVDHIAELSRSAWSPDGSALAYTSNSHCGPRPTIRIVDRQGESTRTLVRNAREPTWSPDGARLAFRTGSYASLVPPDFPPVPENAEAYLREHPDSFGFRARYVLYSDGRFELQYPSHQPSGSQIFVYRGRYSRAWATLTFDFDASSVAGPWQATGILVGRRLTIQYNPIMSLSDFEDGVYVR